MRRLAKIEAVADAAAVIHRQHDIPGIREILVHRVAVGIVIHVMPAQQHLAARATVKENYGGSSPSRAGRQE